MHRRPIAADRILAPGKTRNLHAEVIGLHRLQDPLRIDPV